VIVLILVAILWIAVLVPSLISKLRERRSAGSIGRFHQRLDLLERTGPKLVEPAYRLTARSAATGLAAPIVAVAPPPVRPNLVLVQSPAEGDPDVLEGTIEDAAVALDEPARPLHAMAEPSMLEEQGLEEQDEALEIDEPELAALTLVEERALMMLERRRRARRRRRDTFGALCALAAVTGLLGLVHPLRAAWAATGVFLVLLVVFVGLAVYGARLEAERHHLASLQRSERERETVEEPESTVVKYLSKDELIEYHAALASYYESEHSRLAAQGQAAG
jgi:hypothetical protein